ncbi:MAG: four-carbon acid sugar kinase family protein [Deltaproteobacteria bacterium]|nr:four-carbon acid sugar kinase family protein [Deltaproteobacteria bacterium]
MLPFALLADDLTGACDAGVQFSRRGARVRVEVRFPEPGMEANARASGAVCSEWDLRVVDSDTRHLSPDLAARRCAHLVTLLAGGGWPVRFKKIDSTLRGQIVAELAPLLAGGGTRLLVCPAFPQAGRTLERGVLRVNGIPVSETELGHDPLNPVRQSHLPTLLREGLGVPVAQLTPGAIPGGVAVLAERLESRPEPVLVVDAASVEDLDLWARTVAHAWSRGLHLVAVGSAGLARALADILLPEPPPPPRAGDSRAAPERVAVFAGSRSQVTREQIARLAAEPNCLHLALSPRDMAELRGGQVENAWVARQMVSLRRAKPSQVVLFSLASETVRREDESTAPNRLARLLGGLATALLTQRPVYGLVLTGGDVSLAVLEALNCHALRLGREVLPGIPISRLMGGKADGLAVITKAGGFGPPEALHLAAAALLDFTG